MINKNYVLAMFCILFSVSVNATNIEFPVYGNWCGPGHPAQGDNPKSIDLVDEACKLHDIKYNQCKKENYILMCEAEADIELAGALLNDVGNLNPIQLIVASKISTYFSVQGPMKAITGNTKKLFIDRLQIAAELKGGASQAFLNITINLKGISDGYTDIKNLAVEAINNVTPKDDKSIDLAKPR